MDGIAGEEQKEFCYVRNKLSGGLSNGNDIISWSSKWNLKWIFNGILI